MTTRSVRALEDHVAWSSRTSLVVELESLLRACVSDTYLLQSLLLVASFLVLQFLLFFSFCFHFRACQYKMFCLAWKTFHRMTLVETETEEQQKLKKKKRCNKQETLEQVCVGYTCTKKRLELHYK